MSRRSVLDGAVAAVLALLALDVALPFRAEALRASPVVSIGWDASLHATEGLDLFDDVRLGRPLDALALLASRHWWGPVWALVSAPFQAAFGPSLAAASLPSLLAFVLAPAVAFLLVRRLDPKAGSVSAVFTGLVIACLFLRSPMLLEISAWPMLEGLGGLVALAGFLLFAKRESPAARRAAFVAGTFLFLLKYHFGFFVLATLGFVVWREEAPSSRERLGLAARTFLARGGGGILGLALLFSIGRLTLETRGGDALARIVPSVSNVAWGVLVSFVLLGVVRRPVLAPAWNEASPALRDFARFALLPCAAWCLDPANVRGWYRQIFQPTDVPERSPLVKLMAFGSFLRDDYTIGAGAAAVVALGLVLAIALPGSATRRALAAFAIWPVALMSLNAYPVEPRFLACLVPGLFAASVSGLVSAAARGGKRWREATLLATGVILAVDRDEARWRATTAARAAFRFSFGAVETAAIEADVARAPAEGPVLMRLPADPPVAPAVRLALRVARRDLAPRDVDVSAGP